MSSRLSVQLEPRKWQKRALQAWEEAGRRGVVEVVTGGGKTVFAELCAAAVANSAGEVKIVVVVPTQALLDQWHVSLQEELHLPDDAIGDWSGRGKPPAPRLFNLMVVNTARWAAPAVAAAHSTMLIVDEVHRVGSPRNAESLAGEHLATLGMSATPFREYDDAFERVIAPVLGPLVFTYGVDDAAIDGIISPFDLVNVGVDLLPDEAHQYETLTRRIKRLRSHEDGEGAPPSDERLKVLLRRRARVSALASMRVPVAVRLADANRGARMLIFHEEINPAEAILHHLRERGHRALIYHSKVSDTVRRDNLRLFRQGVFDVLVSCRALDEGINIPETQVAIIAAASASERQRIQRLGRVLRPAPRKTRALIYTLFATDVEERRLADESRSLESAASVSWQRTMVQRG
jgi:superfamily II DNA or RNA helicase